MHQGRVKRSNYGDLQVHLPWWSALDSPQNKRTSKHLPETFTAGVVLKY